MKFNKKKIIFLKTSNKLIHKDNFVIDFIKIKNKILNIKLDRLSYFAS